VTDTRVVISGVGPVSAIGIGREAFFDALEAGRSGIRAAPSPTPDAQPAVPVAEVSEFAVEDYLESEKSYLDRADFLPLDPVYFQKTDQVITHENLVGAIRDSAPDQWGRKLMDAIDHAPGLLRGGGVVQVNQRLSVDLLRQNGKITAYLIDIERRFYREGR